MEVFTDERSLHLQDETFSKLRDDADQVLQKLLANMAEKGSLEGKLGITVDVSFVQETVQNRDANIEGETRVVYTPRFKHKVGSVLQIKNEQKGDMNCDGMEMYWDTEKGEWMLRPITGRDQMSILQIMQNMRMQRLWKERLSKEERFQHFPVQQMMCPTDCPRTVLRTMKIYRMSLGMTTITMSRTSSDDTSNSKIDKVSDETK